MNSVVRQLLEQDTDVVMVDTGDSYEGICSSLHGTYITYSKDRPISMNPFKVTTEEYEKNFGEKKNFLKSLIFLIFKGNDAPTKIEDKIINQTIVEYYEEYFHPFDHFTEEERTKLRERLLLEDKKNGEFQRYEEKLEEKYGDDYRIDELEENAPSATKVPNGMDELEFTEEEREHHERTRRWVDKLHSLVTDKAASEGEKDAAGKQLIRLMPELIEGKYLMRIEKKIDKLETQRRKMKVGSVSFNSYYEFALVRIPQIMREKKIEFDIDNFAAILEQFYKGGELEHTLNNDVDDSLFDARFIVFEIDKIKDDPVLFPIVVLIIMDVFLQKMRIKKGRKALIIEEAWKAISSPTMAEYINNPDLVSVDLSASKVKVIDEAAFSICPSLTSIKWSDCIESIGYCAFSRSPNLDYTFPPTLKILGESAFAQNQAIQHLFVPNFIEGWSTFEKNNPTKDGIPYESQQFSNGVFTDVRWEAGITKITEGQVQSNKLLRTVYIPNSVKTIQPGAFQYCTALTHITLPSWLDSIQETARCKFATPQYGIIEKNPKITEFTIPAYVRFVRKIQPKSKDNNLQSIFVMGDTIPLWHDKGTYQESVNGKGEPITIYVKKSVFDAHYPDGKWSQTWTYPYGVTEKTSTVEFDVSYEVPVTMANAQGEGIMYKTLCRDFDVDLRHTNDNLPEGVEPLRAYLVDDVEGELRMVFLNEIKYIPSRLKANVEGFEDVDEYVGVVLKGTPGYTYHYRIGENDYTQGASGQWLMEQAMAVSGSTETRNLMSGWAHDDRFIPTTEEDEETGDTIVNYGLNHNRFKIYSNEGWLTYNKSFLQLPKSVSDAIERNRDAEGNANLTMVFNNSDGTTDKVSAAEFTRNAESDIFYNPYGQRVKGDTKGIVISNGRKRVNR